MQIFAIPLGLVILHILSQLEIKIVYIYIGMSSL